MTATTMEHSASIIIIISLIFMQNAAGKVFQTEDSVIVQQNDRHRLPGPSIFEYRNKVLFPQVAETPEASSSNQHPTKVKRGNENDTTIEDNKVKEDDEPQRYYEIAGDELYVFEPSPMGARPFLDSLDQAEDLTISPKLLNPQKHSPLEISEKQSVEQSNQSKDKIFAKNVRSQQTLESSSSPEDLKDGNTKCINSNDREGHCIPFRMCYPVVFNPLDGELRNHGLARMLWHASGPACAQNPKSNSFNIGIAATDEGEEFYNDNVCCSLKPVRVSPNHTHHTHHNKAKSNRHKSKKLRMKPSHPDPMPVFAASESGGYVRSLPYHTQLELPPIPPHLLHGLMLKEDGKRDDSHSGADYFVGQLSGEGTATATTTSSSESRKQGNARKILVRNGTNDEAESLKSKVKVELNTNSSSSTAPAEKPKVDSHATAKEHSEGTRSSGDVVVPPTVVAVVAAAPHMSAWNCPGRQMGVLPRGGWPWMVAILNEGIHFCSGSLIDHRHILTSASCVASFQGKEIGKMRVILGDRVLYSAVDGPHLWRKITRITRHLQYNANTMENNIAILEMDDPVTFTPNIQPINLPSSAVKNHTTKAIVSGWSGADLGKRLFSPRSTADALVEFMERAECAKRYHGFSLGQHIGEDIICTKPSEGTCRADLGSPLMMKTGNCWHVIGILSNGLGCGMFPEQFTDTAHHLPWIQKNIRHHYQISDTFITP